MTERQWQYLRLQLRLTEENRADAEEKYSRLGTLRGVMVEYLQIRLNERLLGGVSHVTVPGAVGVTFAPLGISALERWIARLLAGPADPSDPEAVEESTPQADVITIRPSAVHSRQSRKWRHPDTW